MFEMLTTACATCPDWADGSDNRGCGCACHFPIMECPHYAKMFYERERKRVTAEVEAAFGPPSKELKKKIRFLENRGWYWSIDGRYAHQACLTLARSVEEINNMDWDELRALEKIMRELL